MASGPEARLQELGIELPEVPAPAGAYVPATRAGSLVLTAGQLPFDGGELKLRGKVGDAVSVDEARGAARLCALNALAAAATVTGGLSGISRIVKVTGFVASAPGFNGQPDVINGASELLGEVFGDAGLHARSAVGVAELPMDAPVEVELVVEVSTDA
ncbi:MAG TPA: RidA family protein [Rubrobacter sp.]|jgi:enamine deaminase RidA (YjgF/YER057c/UK114 family)